MKKKNSKIKYFYFHNILMFRHDLYRVFLFKYNLVFDKKTNN